MKTKDETKEEFFERVQIPATWRFTGTSSTQNSLGRLYEVEKGVHIRIFFDIITSRGGLCLRDSRNRSMKYTATTWNKTSEALNEWITNNPIEHETEKEETQLRGGI